MCRGKLSDFRDLSFGVPQGSILGPFLFLLFINDISTSFAANDCVINLFADDLLTYVSGKDLADVQRKLQQCVTNICDWYKINRLKANPKKSKLMVIGTKHMLEKVNYRNFSISYDSISIPLVKEFTYLGYLGVLNNAGLHWPTTVTLLLTADERAREWRAMSLY